MVCQQCNVLLEGVCVASSLYYEAVQRVAVTAGRGTKTSFEAAMLRCNHCHDDCRDARAALRLHQTSHGELTP